MNSRLLVAAAAILLCVAIYVSQRSTKSRLAEVEEQVQMLQLVAQRDQFRAENARLRSENKQLREALAQANRTAPGEPIAGASLQEEGYNPNSGRNNPQLMRRYFPQLYKDKMTNQPKSEAIPAPPKE